MFARGWFSFISGSLPTLKRRLARKKCTLPRSEVAKCDTGGVRPTHKQVCLITFQIGDGGIAVAKLYLMKTKILLPVVIAGLAAMCNLSNAASGGGASTSGGATGSAAGAPGSAGIGAQGNLAGQNNGMSVQQTLHRARTAHTARVAPTARIAPTARTRATPAQNGLNNPNNVNQNGLNNPSAVNNANNSGMIDNTGVNNANSSGRFRDGHFRFRNDRKTLTAPNNGSTTPPTGQGQ